MTKTNTTYKVSTIKPSQDDLAFDPKAQKSGAPEDVYKSSSPDSYKDLIKGNFKAESIDGGVLSEMADASVEELSVRNDYHSQMQDLIGSLMVGETRSRPAADTVGNIPYVPDLHKDILRGTDLHMHMEPVVARYAALEHVLIGMYDTLRMALHPRNMHTMTASEIHSLKQYEAKLEDTLRECRFQLEKAHEYLQKQKKAEETDTLQLMPILDLDL